MIKEITARILDKKAVGLIALAMLLFVLLAVSLKPSIARADRGISCASGFILINPDEPLRNQTCVKENDYATYCRVVYPIDQLPYVNSACLIKGKGYFDDCTRTMYHCTGNAGAVQWLIDNFPQGCDNKSFGSQSWYECMTTDTSSPGNAFPSTDTYTHECNGVKISIDVECVPDTNPILSYLGGIINFLGVGVGIVVVAMVITGGVQYVTSRGVPQQIEAARKRITNALIALIMFIFMYAFLQWLIPGGLFG